MNNPDEIYNEKYYAVYGWSFDQYGYTPGWMSHFDQVASRIVQDFCPETFLDAGCALGVLVYQMRQKGVEAFGVDVSTYAIQNVHPDIASFCRQGSISDELDKHYDLISCTEVTEHMSPEETDKAIANFCRHADRVLFSSSPEHYGDKTHINIHSKQEWISMFKQHGFAWNPNYDARYVAPWAFLVQRQGM